MSSIVYLIPVALVLGLCGLGAFIWSLRSDQYNDMDGAANRILLDDDVVATEVAHPHKDIMPD